MDSIEAYGFYFAKAGEPLERRDFTISDVAAGEAVVQIAGCGLCHTDLGDRIDAGLAHDPAGAGDCLDCHAAHRSRLAAATDRPPARVVLVVRPRFLGRLMARTFDAALEQGYEPAAPTERTLQPVDGIAGSTELVILRR